MDITWLGHSCFRLHDADMTVVTDPYPAAVGLRVDNRPAEIVTVSNPHPNHSNSGGIEGGPKVFTSPGEYEYNGVTARGVMTPLAEGQSRDERNVAFTIEVGNINICHLGDLSMPLTTRMVDELKPVDVVLVPTGGHCTMAPVPDPTPRPTPTASLPVAGDPSVAQLPKIALMAGGVAVIVGAALLLATRRKVA